MFLDENQHKRIHNFYALGNEYTKKWRILLPFVFLFLDVVSLAQCLWHFRGLPFIKSYKEFKNLDPFLV